jgi:hypothetical protein
LYGFSSKPPAKFNSLTKDMKSGQISYPTASMGFDEVAGSRYISFEVKKIVDRDANHTYSITTIFLFLFLI